MKRVLVSKRWKTVGGEDGEDDGMGRLQGRSHFASKLGVTKSINRWIKRIALDSCNDSKLACSEFELYINRSP